MSHVKIYWDLLGSTGIYLNLFDLFDLLNRFT